MITDYAFIIFVSIASACLSYFLDFAFGIPGADDPEKINPRAILFSWTYYLAYRRLKNRMSEYGIRQIREAFFGVDNTTLNSLDCVILQQTKRAYQVDIVVKGREFFTWEYSIGMCIFCTNFWLSIFICISFLVMHLNLILLPNFFIFVVPFFSHIILRKLS